MEATLKKELELDGVTTQFDSNISFGAVSEAIKDQLAPARVLTDIFVDDKMINLEEEEKLNGVSFKDLGRVVIKSRDVKELFFESLHLAPRICEALQYDCTDINEFFEKNEVIKAQERIGELTSILEWLLQLISGLQVHGAEKIEEMKYSGGKVMDTINRMQFLLAKLHLYLASEKWQEFRALLTSDFSGELKIWAKLLDELSEKWAPQSKKRDS